MTRGTGSASLSIGRPNLDKPAAGPPAAGPARPRSAAVAPRNSSLLASPLPTTCCAAEGRSTDGMRDDQIRPWVSNGTHRQRARELGIPVQGEPGDWNAITD